MKQIIEAVLVEFDEYFKTDVPLATYNSKTGTWTNLPVAMMKSWLREKLTNLTKAVREEAFESGRDSVHNKSDIEEARLPKVKSKPFDQEKFKRLAKSIRDEGKIEGMKKNKNCYEDQSVEDGVYYEQQRNIGYNQAISDVLNTLKGSDD